jgi:glutamate/tyrosine decarboxylase-like PLP-dependent enzyme
MWNSSSIATAGSCCNDCPCPTAHINWVFLCGLLVGVILNEFWRVIAKFWCVRKASSELKSKIVSSTISRSKHETSEKVCANDGRRFKTKTSSTHALNDSEGGVEILQEALSLFSRHMRKTRNTSKVVEYLSPEEMLDKLFSRDNSGSLSLSSSASSSVSAKERKDNIIDGFRSIQRYSVNTNHPFFFNQLFGSLDPVALAAEIVALSVHTSSYTWETAPVFTMIEREVLNRLSRLVFCNEAPEKDGGCGLRHHIAMDGQIENEYDGLMLPGGALSNLTALHVARYYAKTQQKNNACHQYENGVDSYSFCVFEEEKKQEEIETHSHSHPLSEISRAKRDPDLVAFVSSEAHYSFAKAVSVTGMGAKNLVVVPTLQNGQMDVEQLDILMASLNTDRIPFFVAATAGSTVRGSFDDIDAIVKVCRKHEARIAASPTTNNYRPSKIWIHVDGAWGGSAVFSSRKDVKSLLNGLENVDSFTFNPHKLIGAPQQTTAFVTRHKGILKAANSNGAKYLFDSRKNGAEYDLGDASYTCGRKPDAIKLWAQWKYYGTRGIGDIVDAKVGTLQQLGKRIRESNNFMLACEPWPFNVNFFYLPERIRVKLEECGIDPTGDDPNIPNDISEELAEVSVKLKLRLHQSGEMLIPFQPLSNQKADCFRIVLAGNKPFDENDIEMTLGLMHKYGHNL